LGYLDDQAYLHIVDRSKDMVITGGENVYSAEVEQALVGMPGVAEVAVIGTPDERWGEAVTAVIATANGTTIDASDVDAYCAVRLAGYKRPRVVRFVDSLPRNSFGKVRKDQLRNSERPDKLPPAIPPGMDGGSGLAGSARDRQQHRGGAGRRAVR
jgi:acyl-CoA synthetase (AMP-forming)/AMP-acid ligase II